MVIISPTLRYCRVGWGNMVRKHAHQINPINPVISPLPVEL